MNADATDLRRTLGCFPTGVAIATTLDRAGAPVGLTVSSFNSVSLSPPLVLWSLALTSSRLGDFRGHGSFAINILAAEQTALARRFASDKADRFEGVDWQAGIGGVPVLSDMAATLECALFQTHAGGDHEIFLGEVKAHGSSDRTPMIYGKGLMAKFPMGPGD